jgi:hypothetical protein
MKDEETESKGLIENCPQNQIVVPITELDHSYNEPIYGAREEKNKWKIWII